MLNRLDKARREIERAIACEAQFGHASELWSAWAIRSVIEMDAGSPAVATEARAKAVEAYLAYRRDGVEKHNPDGRIALAVTEPLLANDPATAAVILQQHDAADPDLRDGCAPSSRLCRPSPPAAATVPLPSPRSSTTAWPPRSCS